jgi:hypothetical protein
VLEAIQQKSDVKFWTGAQITDWYKYNNPQEVYISTTQGAPTMARVQELPNIQPVQLAALATLPPNQDLIG